MLHSSGFFIEEVCPAGRVAAIVLLVSHVIRLLFLQDMGAASMAPLLSAAQTLVGITMALQGHDHSSVLPKTIFRSAGSIE
jgi:hypothetical protein